MPYWDRTWQEYRLDCMLDPYWQRQQMERELELMRCHGFDAAEATHRFAVLPRDHEVLRMAKEDGRFPYPCGMTVLPYEEMGVVRMNKSKKRIIFNWNQINAHPLHAKPFSWNLPVSFGYCFPAEYARPPAFRRIGSDGDLDVAFQNCAVAGSERIV